ncbi:MAG: 30S ribosome-binding factor RbfA [Bacteroidales bacterium]
MFVIVGNHKIYFVLLLAKDITLNNSPILMPSTRQLKVASQIQRDIGEIIQRQGMSSYQGALLSVMGVDVSPDLGFAKIVLSVFPSSKIAEVKKVLNPKEIRTELAKRVKHQLRIVPEIAFEFDTSLDEVEKIEQILRENPIKYTDDKDEL